ncbi:GNAT family N-acetyltransferase [Neobacillus cucumis]|uniref:GNAT family N-acetyltransferase n=1 Tax=Neobacillus cucumis TaxID=1740721 RepID=UPI002E1E41FD|nr:GNAT family N-acetyltransferase [Neobacillus cucumis]
MKPILIDFPEEIYSERLFIRKVMPGDGKMLFEAMKASLNELKPWMPWANREQTEQDVEANVRDAYAKFLTREDLRLHIFNRETGQFIGATGLHRMNWEVPKFEIGYWIDTRLSGNGYITESTKALTEFCFNELNAKRVEIRCDSKNTKSRKIPEKLGFTLEGILKNDGISADKQELRDTCIYAKLQ